MNFGQGNIGFVSNQEGGALPGGANIKVIPFVTDFAITDGTKFDVIIVTDELRGGNFIKYTGAQVADNGMIFADSTGHLFKRQIEYNYIDVVWYGAIPVPPPFPIAFDSLPAFNAAITASLDTRNIPSPIVYIRGFNNPANYYYLSGTLNIPSKMVLYGDSPSTSQIVFALNTVGIYLPHPAAQYTQLENFGIKGTYTLPSVDTAHGIKTDTVIWCKNILVNSFAGNGFNCVGDIAVSGTNVSTCQFLFCHSQNNLIHGWYMQGGDSNQIWFFGCEALSNGGCGFADESFLGNVHIGWHLEDNGSWDLTYQRGLAQDGINVYQAIKNNFSGQPLANTDYWLNIGNAHIGNPNILPFNPATVYYMAAAYDCDGDHRISGQNQFSALINIYTESNQPPAHIGAQCITYGGQQAAGVAEGAYITGHLFGMEIINGNIYNGVLFTAPRAYMAAGKFVVGQASGDEIGFEWSQAIEGADFSGTAIKLFGALTTAAMQGRTNVKNQTLGLGSTRGFLISSAENGARYNWFSTSGNQVVTSGNLDNGDTIFYNIASPEFLSVKPEVIAAKKVSVPSAQNVDVTGFACYSKQTTDASKVTIITDQYAGGDVNKNIQYEIDLVAINTATGDIFSKKFMAITFMANNAAVLVLKNKTDLWSYSDPALAACDCNFNLIAGNLSQLYIQGIAATTLQWKVNVKRTMIYDTQI